MQLTTWPVLHRRHPHEVLKEDLVPSQLSSEGARMENQLSVRESSREQWFEALAEARITIYLGMFLRIY